MQQFLLDALLTLEGLLYYFLACLVQTAIRPYLSGVRQLQIAQGKSDPNIGKIPRLHQILREIKTEHRKQGYPSHSHLQITKNVLSWQNSHFKSTTLWAACLTTFLSFCHPVEITKESEGQYNPNTHLFFSNVAINNALYPRLWVKLMMNCIQLLLFWLGVGAAQEFSSNGKIGLSYRRSSL